MASWLRAAGALLITASLLDIFLTTLYARSGAGIFSPFLAKGIWRFFRFISLPFDRNRGTVLSFAGPTILVLMASVWVLLLAFGFALIYWPEHRPDTQRIRHRPVLQRFLPEHPRNR